MEMIKDVLMGLWESSGFAALFVDGAFLWQNLVMILVSFVLLYFAIAKKCEPLLLVPIAFGILLANLPGANPSYCFISRIRNSGYSFNKYSMVPSFSSASKVQVE